MCRVVVFLFIVIIVVGAVVWWVNNQDGSDRIGTITRELDTVQQSGSSGLVNVAGTNQLNAGDVIRIVSGGEGLLDFGDQMRLRLFNDTSVGEVATASAPGTPLDVRMYLEEGGFTGTLVKGGGQAAFRTPNGANITIRGTTFLVVHDGASNVTTVANFEGQVEVSAGNQVLNLPAGMMVDVFPGGQFGPVEPIPFGFQDYERQARDLRSPSRALVLLRERADEPQQDTTPPVIDVVAVDPDEIWIGRSCPNNPGIAEITVFAGDDSGPVQEVSGEWFIGNEQGGVQFERLDDLTFRGVVGPVHSLGSIQVSLLGVDTSGNSTPMRFEISVFECEVEDTTPPVLEVREINPDRILIGGECGDNTGTTEITVFAKDDAGPVAEVYAEWFNDQEQGSVQFERLDDFTFRGLIGPVESVGTLIVSLFGVDSSGNVTQMRFEVPVFYCIG